MFNYVMIRWCCMTLCFCMNGPNYSTYSSLVFCSGMIQQLSTYENSLWKNTVHTKSIEIFQREHIDVNREPTAIINFDLNFEIFAHSTRLYWINFINIKRDEDRWDKITKTQSVKCWVVSSQTSQYLNDITSYRQRNNCEIYTSKQ